MSLFRNSQMRRRGSIVAALGVSAALALGACSTTTTPESPEPGEGAATAEEPAANEDLVLVQAVRSLSNPYHANWVAGGELFAESVGIEQVVLSDDAEAVAQ